jgi:glycosyltransferase involved in cell wall biosynthesis
MPSRSGDGLILFRDGRSTDEKYMPYPLREGETPRKSEVICCSTCPHRREPHADALELAKLGVSCQSTTGKFDLLHVLEPRWDYKGRMWTKALPSEIQGAYTTHLDADSVKKAIEIGNPAVVVFHALIMPVETVREMAKSFQKVSFINLFHGSQNNLLYRPSWVKDQLAFLQLAQDCDNVSYATPDARMALDTLGWQRCVVWPNLLAYDRPDGHPPTLSPPRLLISGRFDIVKAIPTAILAAGLVNQKRPIELHAIIEDRNGVIQAMADCAKVPITMHKFMDWPEFHRFLWSSVSVFVHPSLTDANPHAPLDAAIMGRPVVGSNAVDFLPIQADANNPVDIADYVCSILNDYDTHSESFTAYAIAEIEKRTIAMKSLVSELDKR